MEYINKKIYGLPKPTKKGYSTRFKTKLSPYVHSVNIKDYKYYKVDLQRQGVAKIKYFKTKKEAEIFVQFLRLNNYF